MHPPIPILLYHKIDDGIDDLATPVSVFDKQLAWLSERGYRSLTLDQFEHALENPRASAGGKSFLLTFDDGYVDLVHNAAPVLRRYGFSATAFLITSEISGTHVEWSDVRSLASEGLIQFQSHSHAHAHWDESAAGHETLTKDLADSLDILAAELRVPRTAFRHQAWPWGRCNARWEGIASNLGLRYQHIVQRGAVTRSNQTIRLPRICFDGSTTKAFKMWMSTLSSRAGAIACNKVFGTIRQRRHGIGYA